MGKLWGPVLGWWLWAPCASNWPAHATDRYTGPWNAKTKTPILLVGARYDPGTPYRNAQVAEQRLGNAVLLTLERLGPPELPGPQQVHRRRREMRYLVELITPAPVRSANPTRSRSLNWSGSDLTPHARHHGRDLGPKALGRR